MADAIDVVADLCGPQHPGMYVVLKRNLFYRPDARGYTGILTYAGIYTPEEAARHEDQISGVSIMRWEDAPEFTSACFDDFARKHLQQQRDAAREVAKALARDLAAAQARVAELEGALEPFARASTAFIHNSRSDGVLARPWWAGNGFILPYVGVDHLRAAARALAEPRP